jgi:hypothetical protein
MKSNITKQASIFVQHINHSKKTHLNYTLQAHKGKNNFQDLVLTLKHHQHPTLIYSLLR